MTSPPGQPNFQASQLLVLERVFEEISLSTLETRQEVARRTALAQETVRVWFRNQRRNQRMNVKGRRKICNKRVERKRRTTFTPMELEVMEEVRRVTRVPDLPTRMDRTG